MGSGLLETGENIIGGIARQAGYGCGSDLICAPIRHRGRAVNILAVGVKVRDFEAVVSAFAILHGLQLNNLGIIVIVGLADLHRRADDLAEIALCRDLHADADSITHVSRHGSILATGRAVNIRPCVAAVRAALPLVAQFAAIKAGGQVAGTGGNGATEDDAAGVVHIAREGGIGFNHRRLIHHQLNDMLVADDADVFVALFQIQVQIKGIDLGVCARRNGEAVFVGGGADGISGGRFIAGDIAVARCAIAVACGTQLGRQRLPLEFDGMILAVVHPLNGALPVLEVVDGDVVQRDGLHHTPCVADDLDGSARVKFQIEIIIIFPHERLNVLGGIELSVYLYRTIREALHGVKYHFQPGTRCGIRIHPIAIAICGNIVNVEFGILVGRGKHAALEQQHRDGSHISVYAVPVVNMKAVFEVRSVYDYLRRIFLHTFYHERGVELAAVEDNARLCILLSSPKSICPDNSVEGTAVDREIGIEQLQRQRHCFNLEIEERLTPVPVVWAVDRAVVDRDLRALAVLGLIKIVVADAAAGSIGVRHVRMQLGQRAAVHCEFCRLVFLFGAHHDDAVRFVVIRKGNREFAAALAVIQREFAAANAEQVYKPRPLACVDRDLMTVQIQFLVAYYIDRKIINAHRVIDVFHQLEIS